VCVRLRVTKTKAKGHIRFETDDCVLPRILLQVVRCLLWCSVQRSVATETDEDRKLQKTSQACMHIDPDVISLFLFHVFQGFWCK
jgi:hypothetical protein